MAGAGTVVDSVNKIPQGTTESTRIGRKCTINKISWNAEITLPEKLASATPGIPDVLRVILFVDKQANGQTASTSDILVGNKQNSFRNLANSNRFWMLHDKDYVINYGSGAPDGAGNYTQSRVVRFVNINKNVEIPIEFSDVTGAMSEIRSNNIGVLLISTNGQCGFESKMRLRFKDN